MSVPQAALGAGLDAADAALVPALLASRRRALPHRAALLQAASSAAYAIGIYYLKNLYILNVN